MSGYEKHIWQSGDLITKELLNHIEDLLEKTLDKANIYSQINVKQEACGNEGTKIEIDSNILTKNEGRWSFYDHEAKAIANNYYLIYTILSEDKILYIRGYQYSEQIAAFGFYSGEPSSSTLLYSSNLPQQNDTKIKIGIPEGATYLYVNIGIDSSSVRGIWPFIQLDDITNKIINLNDNALYWRGTITTSALDILGWNNIMVPGVYRGAISSNIPNAPFTEGTGLYTVIVTQYGKITTTSDGLRTQIAWKVSGIPDGVILYRYILSYNPTTADPNWPQWTQWIPLNLPHVNYFKAMTYEPFKDISESIQPQYLRVRDVVLGDDNLYIGTYYRVSSGFPYRIIKKPLGERLDNITSLPTMYDLKILKYNDANPPELVPQDMEDLKDTLNNTLLIHLMAYYNGYLYVVVRAGSGLVPAALTGEPTPTNSYLIVMKADDMSYVQEIEYYERASTVRVYEDEEDEQEENSKAQLLVGLRGGGFVIYNIITQDGADKGKLVEKVSLESDPHVLPRPETKEWLHGAIYYTGEGENKVEHVIMGIYEEGAAGYHIKDGGSNGLSLVRDFKWGKKNDSDTTALAKYGSGLNVFAVEVCYPYAYLTVSPLNSKRQTGINTMGIITLDISSTSNISDEDDQSTVINLGFSAIPLASVGDWACRIAYAIPKGKSEKEFYYVGVGDPAPNFIRRQGNYLYVSNENAGIAVFSIPIRIGTERYLPTFIGNIDLGTWSRYFDIHNNVIFAGGDMDYCNSQRPKVVAVSPVLS